MKAFGLGSIDVKKTLDWNLLEKQKPIILSEKIELFADKKHC